MEIRQINPQDYESVYKLIEKAYKTAKVSDGTEQDFALRLRKSLAYISELDLVMEENGEIIGHVMLTKNNIEQDDGTLNPTLMLAPICIELEHRNRGLGAMLINFALERAKSLGYTSVFLCGNIDYYSRFGFKEISSFGIENVGAVSAQYSLCLELVSGALSGVCGKIVL